ncbi:hypothetical protein [Pseudoalteromonas sp. SK20]|uniref:hypothetical protein n=1 Tax=Pseudoalteromonas sp. SK20 TaxID=1938367 RepID=UPI00097658EE|nr:hypothetical protein [Pseudoalteromonas sp. SK20]
MTESLDIDVFEARELQDGSFNAMSVGTNANGKRLSVTFSPLGLMSGLKTHRKVSNVEWVDSNAHLDGVVAHFNIAHCTEYNGTEAVELGFLPCRPSSFPTESFDVIALSKSKDELWAIGRVRNSVYVFYKKTKRYGDYWIPQKVNDSVSVRDRVQEKLDDGYFATINNFEYDHLKKTLKHSK